MTPARYAEIQSLFLELRELPCDRQTDRLRDIEDRDLVSELAGLLKHDACDEEFLQLSTATLAGQCARDVELTEYERTIGPYRLERVLGEGGFGTVYLARQHEPIERTLAIKLMKPGMASEAMVKRFEIERRSLAMMDHPSIATILDAGVTTQGRPFFAMEWVDGVHIDEYCRERNLTLRQRIELFIEVCEAVWHAHQRGVLHRDLKPSNILVMDAERRPIAKVIDFGIAKAIESTEGDESVTQAGQFVGTIEFMSPEQAAQTGASVDTRSDVYSLGVVLYVLLTGEKPFDRESLLGGGPLGLPQRLRDAEPERPSNATKVFKAAELKGDLDWIILRALAKSADQRYASTRDLADDLQRYLTGYPVEAGPPSAVYQWTRFIRRHRVGVLASTLVLTGLLAGFLGATWGWWTATKANQRLSRTVYRSLISEASNSVREGDVERAWKSLRACPNAHRNWEWSLLASRLANDDRRVLRSQNQPTVVDMDFDFTRDRFCLVTTAGTGEIRSIRDGGLLSVLSRNDRVSTLRWGGTPDSLLGGTISGRVFDWSVEAGTIEKELSLNSGGVYCLELSPDGRRIAVCTGGAKLFLLNRDTWSIDRQFDLPARAMVMRWSPDGSKLACGGLNGQVLAFRETEPEAVRTDLSASGITGLAWESNDALIAMHKDQFSTIRYSNGVPIVTHTLATGTSSTGTATIRAMHQRGDRRAIGSGQGAVDLFDVVSGMRTNLTHLGMAVTSIKLSPEAKSVYVALVDGRVLEIPAVEKPSSDSGLSVECVDAEFLDDTSCVCMTVDGSLLIAKPLSGEIVMQSSAHPQGGWALALSPDRRFIATVGEDFHLRCWSTQNLSLSFEAKLAFGCRDVCFVDANRFVAAPKADSADVQEGTLGIWDVRRKTMTAMLAGHENWVTKLASNGDGQLISSDVNAVVRHWRLEANTTSGAASSVQWHSPRSSMVTSLSLSAESRTLWTGHEDGRLIRWDVSTGTAQAANHVSPNAITDLSLAPGRVVTVSRGAGEVVVWDVQSRWSIASIPISSKRVVGVRWNRSNGDSLVITDDRVRLVAPVLSLDFAR